jgi:hypothetical protein
LIRAGKYEVRNSPLDNYSYTIAKVIARSRAICGLGVSAASIIGSMYTMDCVLKEMGYVPIFLTGIRRLMPNSSNLVEDPYLTNEREHLGLTEELRGVSKRFKNYQISEKEIHNLYETSFLTQDEFLEMRRNLQHSLTEIEAQKQAILKNMLDNIEKGYGKPDDSTLQVLKNFDPTKKSLVLEEIKESGKLTENTFPKAPTEEPKRSPILEALNEKGELKEDIFPKTPTEHPSKSKEIEVPNDSAK